MSIFAKPTAALLSKNKRVVVVGLMYAVILTIMAMAQLFSFEDFLPLVRDFALPGGTQAAYFLAAFIVVAEVFALPYLLRMQLSVAMRWVSWTMGWLVALLWLGVAMWLVLTHSTVTNIGLLGDVVSLAPGWWSIVIGLGFVVLAAWVSWGMWPTAR